MIVHDLTKVVLVSSISAVTELVISQSTFFDDSIESSGPLCNICIVSCVNF